MRGSLNTIVIRVLREPSIVNECGSFQRLMYVKKKIKTKEKKRKRKETPLEKGPSEPIDRILESGTPNGFCNPSSVAFLMLYGPIIPLLDEKHYRFHLSTASCLFSIVFMTISALRWSPKQLGGQV